MGLVQLETVAGNCSSLIDFLSIMLAYPKAEGIPLYMDKLYEYGITMAAPGGMVFEPFEPKTWYRCYPFWGELVGHVNVFKSLFVLERREKKRTKERNEKIH